MSHGTDSPMHYLAFGVSPGARMGQTTVMTADATTDRSAIPEWDVADRMRKALRVADVSVDEMSNYLGVNRQSVGRWINGRGNPSRQTLMLWAMRTGVPYEWLAHSEGLEPPTCWLGVPTLASVYSFPAAALARALGQPGRAFRIGVSA